MPHLNKLYDFVVSIFVVCRGKVLFVNHKRYGRWLPLGGHIEMNEDPEEALYREIEEESGLKVRVLAAKPPIGHAGVKPILRPDYVDVHRIQGKHKHIAFVYFGISSSDRVRLHTAEHRSFRWFTRKMMLDSKYRLSRSIRFYGLQALKAARGRP